MSENENEIDAAWLAGVMDCFGQIGIKKKTLFVKFKSAYPDRLQAISAILNINRPLAGPFPPSGISKQPHYELTLVGAQLVQLENLVTSRMRTAKRYLFGETRLKLQHIRKKAKLSRPFKIASADKL